MMNKINISHVTNMHSQWLRTLNFYKTEITIQKGILTEIAGKNTGEAIQKDIEHFENQFKIQTNNIDTLAHDIHVNIDAIAREASVASAGYIDGLLVAQHTVLGNKTEEEEKEMQELIHAFRRFAEQWM